MLGTSSEAEEIEYLRKEVVHDVAIDDAVEDVLANEAEWSIDSLESAVGVVPSISFEVLVVRVSVVQVSDCHCNSVSMVGL